MSTPIVLFVYNRPEKTRQILAAIMRQTVLPAEIIIFSDGAKKKEDEEKVSAVREIIRNSININSHIIKRDHNYGCASNIIRGLTEVFTHYQQAVILEDDTLPTTNFYAALCGLLNHYTNEEVIFSVGGFPTIKKHLVT
jgi:GT2 family glycosyltransferase